MAPCPKPKARPKARPTARAIRQTGSIRALLPEQMRPPTARRADRNDKAKRAPTVGPFFFVTGMVTPGRLELPAYGLGNRRSILLSYGVTPELLPHFLFQCHNFGDPSGLILKAGRKSPKRHSCGRFRRNSGLYGPFPFDEPLWGLFFRTRWKGDSHEKQS